MWLTFLIKKDVAWFYIAVKNAVLVRVVDCARYLRNQFDRLPDRHWLALGNLIKLAALNKLHAEVTGAIALADFVDGNDTGMIQAGGGFRFPAKALQMRVGSPMAQADHLESNSAVETFLPRAIDYALAATTDFFQQFVIAKIAERLCLIRCNPDLSG